VGSYTLLSNSPSSTLSLGKRLGTKLRPGTVIALIGELGCGKTLLSRGICEGLGVPPRMINSPTFMLVNEYNGRLPVFHMDLYRLDNITEEFEIGMVDYFRRGEEGVVIIEWAEKGLEMLQDYLKVEFTVLGTRKRQLRFDEVGKGFTELIGELGLK